MTDTARTAEYAPLNRATVLALTAIILAAQNEQRVGRFMSDGEPGVQRIVRGTARRIVANADSDSPVGDGDDLRDAYLRVTADGIGVDYYWPLSELVVEYVDGTFSTTAA